MPTARVHKTVKRGFSKFTRKEVFEYIGITHLTAWSIEFAAIDPSDYFQDHLERIAYLDLSRKV